MSSHYFSDSSPPKSQRLFTPTDTPQRTPMFSTSLRSSSGRGTPPSIYPLTPPLHDDFGSSDEAMQKDNSGLDSRSFTPSLHASLVSQILSLRRDRDSNNSYIERLEGSLSAVTAEKESLQEDLAKNSRELRTVQRQLQSVEDATLLALEELCNERDAANEAAEDLRRRVEDQQKKLKRQQDELDDARKRWDTERSTWDDDKRRLELKVDVAGARLRNAIDEFAAEALRSDFDHQAFQEDGLPEGDSRDSTGSMTPKRSAFHQESFRRSDPPNETPATMPNGVTLEDELDNYSDDSDDLEDPFNLANCNRRSNVSRGARLSGIQNEYGRRDSALASEPQRQSFTSIESEYFSSSSTPPRGPLTIPEDAQKVLGNLADFQKAAVVTPESSSNYAILPQADEAALTTRYQESTTEEEKRRMRPKQELALTPIVSYWDYVPNLPSFPMAVAAAPPETEISPEMSLAPVQRSDPATSLPRSTTVPIIAIHPPSSEPSTPDATVMVKDFGYQRPTTLNSSRSRGIQTEVSRAASDLHSAATTTSYHGIRDRESTRVQPDPAMRFATENSETGSVQISQDVPGQASNSLHHEVDEGHWNRLRKSLMLSGRYARVAEDVVSGGKDYSDPSEDEAMTSQPSKRHQRQRRSQYSRPAPSPVPEVEEESSAATQRSIPTRPQTAGGSQTSIERFDFTDKSRNSTAGSRNSLLRGGFGAFSYRPRSLSNTSSSCGPPPPFAVPVRHSSANWPHHVVEGLDSPTQWSGASSPIQRSVKRPGSKPALRKARSATNVAEDSVRSESLRNKSPMKLLGSSFRLDERRSSYSSGSRSLGGQRPHRVSSSFSSAKRISTAAEVAPVSGGFLQHSVVDAIVATMVGEWMWKYVRRRKTFSMLEASQDPSRTGETRHKRWVWISPYERTVMWSNKQPTTDAALMGRNGRKLPIQSVLDVRDDTARPRSSSGLDMLTNRSILILTPSRALKFTAATQERHYIWLTALSFLAHHTSQGPLDLSFLAPLTQPVEEDDDSLPPRIRPSASIRPSTSRTSRPPPFAYSRNNGASANVSYNSLPKTSHPHPNPPSHDLDDAALPPHVPRVPTRPGTPQQHRAGSVPTISSRFQASTSSLTLSSSSFSFGRPRLQQHNSAGAGRSSSLRSLTPSVATGLWTGQGTAALPRRSSSLVAVISGTGGEVERVKEKGRERGPAIQEAGWQGVLDEAEEEEEERRGEGELEREGDAEFGGNANFFDAVVVRRPGPKSGEDDHSNPTTPSRRHDDIISNSTSASTPTRALTATLKQDFPDFPPTSTSALHHDDDDYQHAINKIAITHAAHTTNTIPPYHLPAPPRRPSTAPPTAPASTIPSDPTSSTGDSDRVNWTRIFNAPTAKSPSTPPLLSSRTATVAEAGLYDDVEEEQHPHDGEEADSSADDCAPPNITRGPRPSSAGTTPKKATARTRTRSTTPPPIPGAGMARARARVQTARLVGRRWGVGGGGAGAEFFGAGAGVAASLPSTGLGDGGREGGIGHD